jgi:hypothetical protein
MNETRQLLVCADDINFLGEKEILLRMAQEVCSREVRGWSRSKRRET